MTREERNTKFNSMIIDEDDVFVTDKLYFAWMLPSLRKKFGWKTRGDLAKKIGVSESTIALIESGARVMTDVTYWAIKGAMFDQVIGFLTQNHLVC